jgi:peptide/nickel transport system substrate-binding protein
VRDVLGGAGRPSAWVSHGSVGENPDLKPLPYDPERSKKLLAEAGYPNGLDIDMEAPSGRYLKDKEIAEALVGQLAKAGVRVHLRIVDYTVLSKRVFAHEVSPLSLLAWGNAELDPALFDRSVLESNGIFTQFADPKYDAIMASANSQMDPEKRRKGLYEQQAYERKEFPIVYVAQIGQIVGVSKKLFDWTARSDERFYFLDNNVVQ